MLAGNRLTRLPDEMVNCKKLGLLRLSVNNITSLPTWLFSLPELAFLSFAGNPYAPSFEDNPVLEDIAWSELTLNEMLGEGASGIISKGVWKPKTNAPGNTVAIKLFKGSVTSDGSPVDELIACITAGSHPNLIDPIAKIHGHPEGKPGLVLQLIPPHYTNLGLPPTLQSCTRDSFVPGTIFSAGQCMTILRSVASAAAHLHVRGIAHGDLYAHNILIDEAGHALLGDFGAATLYRQSQAKGEAIERLEVLAFGHLVEDLLGLVDHGTADEEGEFLDLLQTLHRWCTTDMVLDRPSFLEVCKILDSFRRF
jgi:serine/threonine protein kinase